VQIPTGNRKQVEQEWAIGDDFPAKITKALVYYNVTIALRKKQ
jgi:hypothetical protein